MAPKTTLNAANLEALGAPELARLLIEASTGNAPLKQRLRLALAGTRGAGEVAREVGARLTAIARGRSHLDGAARKALVADLEAQRRAIADVVAPDDPAEALALMWRLVALAPAIAERCGDGSSTVDALFQSALETLGTVALAARPPPETLAASVLDALLENATGIYDDLIAIVAPALGPAGLAHLRGLIVALDQTPIPPPPQDQMRIIAYGLNGPFYAHEGQASMRRHILKAALKAIADAEGDVDAFIAQFTPQARKGAIVAADIAQRLLAAGRADEALTALDAVDHSRHPWLDRAWYDARLAALDSLHRKDEAQAMRWDMFCQTLSPDMLRDYLARLPDFEDAEAEARAIDLAAAHADLNAALMFLTEWRAHDRAGRLILARHAEIDGNDYEVLVPVAEALADTHPLAATIALRAMVDFALARARSARYGHAARHLATCARLAPRIASFAPVPAHADYLATLRRDHGRKDGFWSMVKGA